MLPVSLDCPFLIAPLAFSDVNIQEDQFRMNWFIKGSIIHMNITDIIHIKLQKE
jgi:hypothetical protein